jgi:NOL1/NOP2/fmu family ribosome biogenesis protein
LNEWNENVVNLCSRRQQRILADVWKCLKPNGVLIYSTCSFSESENEGIADWMVDAFEMENIALQIPAEWNVVSTQSKKHQVQGFRFYPHLLQGEGFFCTVMRKKNKDFEPLKFKKSKPKNIFINKTILNKWLKNIDAIEFHQKQDFIIAQPKILADDFECVASQLNVIKSGINIGQITVKDLIPEHELAMSFLLNDEIQKIELTYEQAIQYLKKESLDLTPSLSKREGVIHGWTLMQYQQKNLGWAKFLPHRINNYYPMNGRILK